MSDNDRVRNGIKLSQKRIPLFPGLIAGLFFCGFFFANVHAAAAGETSPGRFNPPQAEGTPAPVGTEQAASTAFPTPSQTPDKYYADYFARSWDIPEEAAQGNTFWIEVDLSAQTLSAYRGGRIVDTFLISSGTDAFPTVTGTYRIYAKYSQYTMRGPDYDIPDVPYSMFFYKGYSIHGTYWHDDFGQQMSRGCVNMKTEEAAWIYENAPVGTYVFIHY